MPPIADQDTLSAYGLTCCSDRFADATLGGSALSDRVTDGAQWCGIADIGRLVLLEPTLELVGVVGDRVVEPWRMSSSAIRCLRALAMISGCKTTCVAATCPAT